METVQDPCTNDGVFNMKDYYLNIIKNEILIPVVAWINLENLLDEINPKRTTIGKFIGMESMIEFSRGVGRGREWEDTE